MAATAPYTVVVTAMTGSDVDITLPTSHPTTLTDQKLIAVWITMSVAGTMVGPDGSDFPLPAGTPFSIQDPNLGGTKLTFNAASGNVAIVNWFGLGR